MTNLEDLKKQVSSIMENNKPKVIYNTQEDKLIRELELELTTLGLKQEFTKTILELDPQNIDTPFGASGFKRDQYALSWKLWENKDFRLVLTNIPHNNSKLLLTVPSAFKKDVCLLLKEFAKSLLK